MDIVTDLSSRAISFLSAYKEICNILGLQNSALVSGQVQDNTEVVNGGQLESTKLDLAKRRAWELFPGAVLKTDNVNLAKLLKVTHGIVLLVENQKITFEETFLSFDENQLDHSDEQNLYKNFLSEDLPVQWRQGFRKMLYGATQNRVLLVEVLAYMPYLIILAVEKKVPDITLIHQYQDYSMEEGGQYVPYWRLGASREAALNYLVDDMVLLQELNKNDLTVPFELLFFQELEEIKKFSDRRYNPGNPKSIKRDPTKLKDQDPLALAKKMQLKGITFSGGGIRSATFNLGVLQKLAKLDRLREFDYLSTVSGGGYIGSWWVSWIKRLGSFKQVNKLLNPDISGDPLSEEVRPIRWLRMYSNYLAPATGITSTDSVTAGLTWLRNTIINQSLLILMLCTLLASLSLLFELWNSAIFAIPYFSLYAIIPYSIVFLGTTAFFTGAAMKIYSTGYSKENKRQLSNKTIANSLLIWGGLSGLFISSWMAAEKLETGVNKPLICAIVGSIGFLAMLAVSFIGNYKTASHSQKYWVYYFWLTISSAAAGALGGYLLKVSWELVSFLQKQDFHYLRFSRFPDEIAFIIGPPLILECFSLAVVTRMLLMGILFPDERREWWGRMGALLHKGMVAYLLLTFGALMLPQLIFVYTKELVGLAGGWMAIVLWAVKTAYSSASSPAKKEKSGIKQILIKIAPFLFMIIFLLLGAYILEVLQGIFNLSLPLKTGMEWLFYTLFCLGLGILSYVISYRIGVNEFSLHHFYRNRLTRAYLGATRRRTDREETANDFTGFDTLDEMPLNELLFDKGYKGPYPILNTAMNASTVSELDRQDRKAESFIFSPLFCGYDFSTTRSAAESKNGIFQYGYRETPKYAQTGGPGIGTAMAISGAAVNPNMGYHSSAPVAFLLTVFNVRLGRWMGNPRLNRYGRSDPETGLAYLVYDLIGKSDINKDYVCLSDGGHFDNMGIYELVRRRCSYILVCDSEGDENATCEGLANAIRRCRIDFGVNIQIDIGKIVNADPAQGLVKQHTAKGSIWYPGDGNKPSGKIVYIKTALTGNEGVDVREYKMNNEKFPQESTGDQFFNESQFESYRRLGYHSINSINQL